MFGIYQEVQVEQGGWYTFTAWARVESAPAGEMAAYVGIQPWGGGLFERQMIWGKETQTLREWARTPHAMFAEAWVACVGYRQHQE